MSITNTFTTTICHRTRKELNLTCNEYCICDLANQQAEVAINNGWCQLSRSEIADMMGISKQAVIKLIGKLIRVGILVKEANGSIKTSAIWNGKFHQSPMPAIEEPKKGSTFVEIWTPSILQRIR